MPCPCQGATARLIELAPSQFEWMERVSAEHSFASAADFGSAVVQACKPLNSADVFGKIRRKTATGVGASGGVAALADASTPCAGAQEALAAQKKS